MRTIYPKPKRQKALELLSHIRSNIQAGYTSFPGGRKSGNYYRLY